MNTILSLLSRNRFINLISVILFYLLVVLPHEQVGIWISGIFKNHTRAYYDFVILMLTSGLFLCYLIPIALYLKKVRDINMILLLCFNCIFAIYAFHFLFVVNIEAIHFIQYAILGILIFPLLNNYLQTIGYAAVLGAMDEAYQYFYLAPDRTEYFDFNDVIINLIGVGFGMILIRTIKPTIRKYHFSRSPFFYLITFISVITIVLFALGILTTFTHEGGRISLIRVEQKAFWTVVYPSIIFHVVRPLPALGIIGCLFVLYNTLFRDR